MGNVLVFSGGGEYADPWHPFAETTSAIAELLRDDGHDVTVVDSVDALIAAPRADLVIVNAGSGGVPHPRDPELLADLEARFDTGTPLLVFHVASTLLPDEPEWEHMLGGRWVRGVTMHPPSGRALVDTLDTEHPITAGLEGFELDDERYSWLRVADDVTVLATQQHEGETHPIIWVRDAAPARIVYDALGHDAASFTNAEHRALIQRAVLWLLEER